MKKKRTPSSSRWLKEHHDDEYVLRARKEGWRSRAIYKISEMDEKDLLFKELYEIKKITLEIKNWMKERKNE